MNNRLKIILAGLVLCLMTHGLMLFIDHYFLIHLGDWTMRIAEKYLVFNWTAIDRLLIRWLPLIVGFLCVLVGIKKLHVFIKRVLWTLMTVVGFIIFAVLIALMTWRSDGGDSPLLPEYLKYQPFMNYWTIFIALGLILPMFTILKRSLLKTNDESESQIIDK